MQILDVRPADIADATPIPGSLRIPYKEINNVDLNSVLDKNTEYKTVCLWGKTAYFSSRILENQGFNSSTLIGGMTLHQKPEPKTK
jgi:rhodanese-related sulfurtransferase